MSFMEEPVDGDDDGDVGGGFLSGKMGPAPSVAGGPRVKTEERRASVTDSVCRGRVGE